MNELPELGLADRPAILGEGVLIRWAMDGDPIAVRAVLRLVAAVAVRYCRARIGRVDGTYAVADAIARDVRDAVLTALAAETGAPSPLSATVYLVAARLVAARHPRPSALLAALPRSVREVVILRTVLRWTPDATADVLGWSAARVERAERRALRCLRDLPRPPSAAHPAADGPDDGGAVASVPSVVR